MSALVHFSPFITFWICMCIFKVYSIARIYIDRNHLSPSLPLPLPLPLSLPLSPPIPPPIPFIETSKRNRKIPLSIT